MHVTFWFSSAHEKFMRLPSANLHLFQAMLYSLLPPDEAQILHDDGFSSGGKTLKLFAMSWPAADSQPTFGSSTVLFPLPVRLTVSTHDDNLANSLSAGALGRNDIRIGNNHVVCSKVILERQAADKKSLLIQTLSPITTYFTTERDGKPYTIYFAPENSEFQDGLRANLVRKFKALYPERELPAEDFRITPVDKPRQKVSMFDRESSFPVKGWWGKFKLEGSKELLQVALDCGLGAKSSSGWGCITKL